jgi:hypothetical protein
MLPLALVEQVLPALLLGHPSLMVVAGVAGILLLVALVEPGAGEMALELGLALLELQILAVAGVVVVSLHIQQDMLVVLV